MPTGEEVPTVEHAYQAEKFADEGSKATIIAEVTGQKAKRKADQLQAEGRMIIPNWSYLRVDIMRSFVYQKFTRSEELGHRLIDTGDEEIIEGNTWEDTFWGVYPTVNRELTPQSEGLNWLGRILMETRTELQLLEGKATLLAESAHDLTHN